MYVCMCVCVWMWVWVYVYVCMYACMHVFMHYVSVYVCMYVRMYVCVYVCLCMCVCVCMYVRVCACACVYACMFLRACMCVYVSGDDGDNTHLWIVGQLLRDYTAQYPERLLSSAVISCLLTYTGEISDTFCMLCDGKRAAAKQLPVMDTRGFSCRGNIRRVEMFLTSELSQHILTSDGY
jgi:hypothetical protein